MKLRPMWIWPILLQWHLGHIRPNEWLQAIPIAMPFKLRLMHLGIGLAPVDSRLAKAMAAVLLFICSFTTKIGKLITQAIFILPASP